MEVAIFTRQKGGRKLTLQATVPHDEAWRQQERTARRLPGVVDVHSVMKPEGFDIPAVVGRQDIETFENKARAALAQAAMDRAILAVDEAMIDPTPNKHISIKCGSDYGLGLACIALLRRRGLKWTGLSSMYELFSGKLETYEASGSVPD